jgi:hypothetical protein
MLPLGVFFKNINVLYSLTMYMRKITLYYIFIRICKFLSAYITKIDSRSPRLLVSDERLNQTTSIVVQLVIFNYRFLF